MKSLIPVSILLASLSIHAQTDLSSKIPKLKPAIFLITTFDENENVLGTGTGFFIDSLGTGVSCYHVFEGATKAIAKTSNGKEYAINNVITQSKQHDQLKFSIANEDHEKFKYIKIDYLNKNVGENIFVIGNPLGLEYTVSNGIISALRQDEDFGKVIQITAPISPGSSGSPLLNSKGNAIGIITYSYEEGQNLNFAVSLEELKNIIIINSSKFPESPYKKFKFKHNDIFRIKIGAAKFVIEAMEKRNNSSYNEFMTNIWNEMLKTGNNYSTALCYDGIMLADIKTDLEYSFEHDYLKTISYNSTGTRKTPATTAALYQEFFDLKEYLSSLYGAPSNGATFMSNCKDCYLGSVDKLESVDDLKLLIANESQTIPFIWNGSDGIQIIAWVSPPDEKYSGLWHLNIEQK